MKESYDPQTNHDNIEAQYNIISDLFAELGESIISDVRQSRYYHSCHALYYAIKKIDEQLNVLKWSNEAGTYYVNRILYRTIYDHFLVAYYIAVKCRLEDSDEAGIDYYGAYGQKEIIKRYFQHYAIEDLKNNVSRGKNAEAYRIEKFNQDFDGIYHPLTSTEKDAIYLKAAQFKEDKIIGYLLHKTQDDPMAENNKAFYSLLHTYNVVSSNVHGGPSAEREAFYSDEVDKLRKLDPIHIDICKFCSYSIKLNLLYLLNKDFDRYNEVFKVLRQMNNHFKEM